MTKYRDDLGNKNIAPMYSGMFYSMPARSAGISAGGCCATDLRISTQAQIIWLYSKASVLIALLKA